MPYLLVTAASAGCASHYTCCAQWDFFIPVNDNCARNGQSKVPLWARMEKRDWLWNGICSSKTPVVTRAEIEAKEKKEKEFQMHYDKFCVRNAANCSATEKCYYDKRHLDGKGGEEWSGVVK